MLLELGEHLAFQCFHLFHVEDDHFATCRGYKINVIYFMIYLQSEFLRIKWISCFVCRSSSIGWLVHHARIIIDKINLPDKSIGLRLNSDHRGVLSSPKDRKS